MGHYSDLYDEDNEKDMLRRFDKAKDEIRDFIMNSDNIENLEFVARICRRIEDIKTFFKVLNWNLLG